MMNQLKKIMHSLNKNGKDKILELWKNIFTEQNY